MESVRNAIADDLEEILEDEFGEDILLISPDGVKYPVRGSTLLDSVIANEFGEVQYIDQAHVNLRIRSLTRVPVNGENWIVKFDDIASGDEKTFLMEKALLHGKTLGKITLLLTTAEQS